MFVYFMLPGQKLSRRVTRASISAEVSECYRKYKGRSVHALFCMNPNIAYPTDSRSLLLTKNLQGEGKEKPIKFSSAL